MPNSRFLSRIYDIKSAVSTLNPAELLSVAGAMGKRRLRLKGILRDLQIHLV
ncbi:hypothetical protein LEP1GSC049_1252 [Leptospira kirschneri serovar Cynopteri str. 3522 CT]|nr:hypothetical protein LEP1GSC046_1457 [Leptospira kirschneri serovar Bim str. 1051]EPG49127.1 hypothetical protein LEP1GSC049_1252 [Leptospira kirschneri serovar Cynopteri str. 3522 CT]